MQDKQSQDQRPIVVCLHSSASNGGQWRSFRQALRGRCRVFTPDLIGYGSRSWRPGKPLSLQDEVDAVIEQIGDTTEPFHLIGHSYGGAVAVYLAKRYPERIRSLILYEPVNFAMLFRDGLETEATREVSGVSAVFSRVASSSLARWRAARMFISYWSGPKAWRSLRFSQRSSVARKMPKVGAEFDALRAAGDTMSDVSDLEMPVKIICGTRTRAAARRVCDLMAAEIPDCRLLQLVNLGHMAPLTDPNAVNPLLIDYVVPVIRASAASAGKRSA